MSPLFRGLLLGLLLSTPVSVAYTQQLPVSPYVGVKVGGGFQELDDVKNTTNVANPATVNVTSEDDLIGIVGATVGVDFKRQGWPVRAEIEYTYRTDFEYNPNPNFTNAGIPTRSENELTSHVVMANAYFDFDTGTKFTPFVGGGLGVAFHDTDTKGVVIATGVTSNFSQSATEFAWAVGAGVSYAFDQNWRLDLSYRYIDLGEVSFGDRQTAELTGDVQSHDLMLTLRYNF